MIKRLSNISGKTLNNLSKARKVARQGLIELYHHPIKHPINGAKVVGKITKKGFTGLYNYPIKHPINTTKTFVKNSWDIGTSVFTEWGISQYGLAIIQRYSFPLRITNALITAIPVIGSKERGGRNILLQSASWAFFTGTTAGRIGAGILAAPGIYFEVKRIKKIKDKKEQKPISNPYSLEENLNGF